MKRLIGSLILFLIAVVSVSKGSVVSDLKPLIDAPAAAPENCGPEEGK